MSRNNSHYNVSRTTCSTSIHNINYRKTDYEVRYFVRNKNSFNIFEVELK